MIQTYFLCGILLYTALLILWGYKVLPKENWQILAVLPREKNGSGLWKGVNLTYYGFFVASAYTFAVIIFLILMSSVGVPLAGLGCLVFLMAVICLPAAKIIARIVERQTGTLTVGGAVFAAILTAPLICEAANRTLGSVSGFEITTIAFLCAACVAYAFGEGLGRLACISFGCCYGKPVHQCSPFFQKLFSNFFLVFHGHTKKIAYASGLDGQKVVPIQIITAVIYCSTGLFGTWLFLNNHPVAALLLSLIITQLWRFASEFLRADFRGGFKITPYQIMSIATIIFACCLIFWFPIPEQAPDLEIGLKSLWNPWTILLIESVWLVTFIYTGKSVVTSASVSFHVLKS